MNEKDIAEIMLTINANYGGTYIPSDPTEERLLIQSWMCILGKYPKPVVMKALYECIAHDHFAPRVGDIVSKIEELQECGATSPEVLWSELTEAVRKAEKYAYQLRFPANRDDAIRNLNVLYNRMPEEIKAYCGSLNEFTRMANEWEPDSYERARFIKRIPELRKELRINGHGQVMITAEGRVKSIAES